MNYVTLYNKNAAFYGRHPKMKKGVLLFNRLSAYPFAVCYALLLGHTAVREPLEALGILLFAPLFALLVVSVLRLLFKRARPYEAEGANITPLAEKQSRGASFPSRHLASATILSACFFPYFPVMGILLFVLTMGMGYARFAVGWHYPIDLLVGFLLGLASGGFLFLL